MKMEGQPDGYRDTVSGQGAMTSILTEGIVLRWVDGVLPSLDDAGVTVPFDTAAWNDAGEFLEPDSGAAYVRLAKDGEFGSWWQDRCGGDVPGIRRIRLQFPPAVWGRPWEGLVGGLHRTRWSHISLIRQLDGDPSWSQPDTLDEPLTVLCLQGASAAAGLAELDVNAEFRSIHSAHAKLDRASQAAICLPTPVQALRETLIDQLRQHRPNVVWFSGHARNDPPGLLLADGTWLKAEDFASSVAKAATAGGRTPLYVVLWACQTASVKRFDAQLPAPSFVDTLFTTGVAAVLAAQAPLNDAIAGLAATHIFSALAAGRPIDHAMARLRGALMVDAGDSLHCTIDWMCPVVWTQGVPPPRLNWSDGRERDAQHQSLARKLLPARLSVLPTTSEVVDAWPTAHRVWVVGGGPAGAAEALTTWAARVLARQQIERRSVLWFDFMSSAARGLSVERILRDWARIVLRCVEHDDDRDRTVRDAAKLILDDCQTGWRKLCASEPTVLAILDPPASDLDWFWAELRGTTGATAVVLCEDYPAQRGQEGWCVESIGGASNDGTPTSDQLIALAVLRCPADRIDIEAVVGASIQSWIGSKLVLETSAGCLMPWSVASHLVGSATPESREAGHRLAYLMLDGTVARRKLGEEGREDLLLARLEHASAPNSDQAGLIEVEHLIKLYRAQGRPSAVLDLLERTQVSHGDLSDAARIDIAWAHWAEADVPAALSCLDSVQPEALASAELAGEWYLLKAEVLKSSVDAVNKAEARPTLESGVKALEEDFHDAGRRSRLRCRHDLARLTHFFDGRPEHAVAEYEAIITEWSGITFSDLDRAITLRNLAEALRDCGRIDEAANRVSQARKLIPSWTRHHVVSELEYLAGKLAQAQNMQPSVIIKFFELCRDLALETNHLMMAAIAEARVFWLRDASRSATESFDDAAWQTVAVLLAGVAKHVWAARVLLSGRVCAARGLRKRGDHPAALSELQAALELIDHTPALTAGSDRERIAMVFAGLEQERPLEQWWDRFRRRYVWAADSFPSSAAAVFERVG